MARQDVQKLPLQIRSCKDAVDQVGAVERTDEFDRIDETELSRDVLPNARGRGCSERVQGDPRQQRAEAAELAVLGTEIMSPLADAVRLVDRDEAHIARGENLDEAVTPLADEALRR